jgi:hypothetical protein
VKQQKAAEQLKESNGEVKRAETALQRAVEG